MKRLFLLIVFCLVVVRPNVLLAEDIYKDKDGVWRNREEKTVVSTFESSGEAYASGVKAFTDATFGEILRDHNEKSIQSTKQLFNRLEEKRILEDQYKKDIKVIEELKQPKIDFTGYERFDPAKAGEVKSDWEYFDDPRSKK